MPLERYPQPEYELIDERVPLWRHLEMWKLENLVKTGKLYFSRADFLNDAHEGLPPEQMVHDAVAGMPDSGHTSESITKVLKDDRHADFVCCWTADESIEMWKKFAPDGVAVRTQSGLLKSALDAMPARAMVGYVNYAAKPPRFNLLAFITTKRLEFKREKEVRAFVWEMEHAPSNPYPHVPPKGLAFDIDIQTFVQEVIVSPYAPAGVLEATEKLLADHAYKIPVVKSAFTGFDHLLPSVDQIAQMFRGEKPTV